MGPVQRVRAERVRDHVPGRAAVLRLRRARRRLRRELGRPGRVLPQGPRRAAQDVAALHVRRARHARELPDAAAGRADHGHRERARRGRLRRARAAVRERRRHRRERAERRLRARARRSARELVLAGRPGRLAARRRQRAVRLLGAALRHHGALRGARGLGVPAQEGLGRAHGRRGRGARVVRRAVGRARAHARQPARRRRLPLGRPRHLRRLRPHGRRHGPRGGGLEPDAVPLDRGRAGQRGLRARRLPPVDGLELHDALRRGRAAVRGRLRAARLLHALAERRAAGLRAGPRLEALSRDAALPRRARRARDRHERGHALRVRVAGRGRGRGAAGRRALSPGRARRPLVAQLRRARRVPPARRGALPAAAQRHGAHPHPLGELRPRARRVCPRPLRAPCAPSPHPHNCLT